MEWVGKIERYIVETVLKRKICREYQATSHIHKWNSTENAKMGAIFLSPSPSPTASYISKLLCFNFLAIQQPYKRSFDETYHPDDLKDTTQSEYL